VSRNPFLAEFEGEPFRAPQTAAGGMSVEAGRTSPKKATVEDQAAQLFVRRHNINPCSCPIPDKGALRV